MHWMIKCRSKPNTDALRNKTIEDHKKHLDKYRDNTWFSGPLFSDDGTSAIGSLRFIEFPDRAAAEAYIEADPYTTAGIFAEIDVVRWEPGLTHKQLTYPRKDGTLQFIVRSTDAPNACTLRAPLVQAHRDYMDRHADIIIARGRLVSDDGAKPVGSAVLLDVADRAAAEIFWANEPFNEAGVYHQATIDRWIFGHV